MIRIQQLKLPVTHTQEELEQKIRKTLKIGKHDLQEIELLRRSIDARKKSELKYVYQLDVKVKDENAVLRKAKNNQIVKAEKKPYVFPKSGEQTLVHRPVIIGSGPAGLFCAYVLAKHGYRPLVLERGESAEQRKKSVDAFWKTGVLNPESNVQFGEGGAGTFSDGKLNTSVKDPSGRNREVLRIFTECGAPEEILYDQKPHLGTDQLIGIVTTMRKKIEAWGGEVRFGAKVTDFGIENGRLTSVTVNETEKIAAETAVLAIGHSARDTFFKLCENKISMEAKSFAVGVRIEHPQKMITEDQYGPEAPDFLGAAPYKLTNQCENGTIIYNGSAELSSEELENELPKYGDPGANSQGGVYFRNEKQWMVKQVDYENVDGKECSAFIVTKTDQIAPQITGMARELAVVTVLILVFTSLGLSLWIYRGVIGPLGQLKKATQNIKDGNLDFTVEPCGVAEINDLCEDFEEMRIRLKETAEEKVEFDKENKELISNISHDLKTPITAVKGYVEGIMDGVANTPEKMDRYIRTIYNKANEMDRLINELTFYSKIDTNRIPYTFSKIHIADYFDDCVEELNLELDAQHVDLTYFNYLEDDPVVIADAEQIKRVINNIVSNSIKYMDKSHKVINIRLRDVGDFVQVEIEDNGKGIATKDLTKIFDRFYRTDASRNSTRGGSGIGLSIVKKILEDHGGKVWATSKEGVGTTMYFVLRKYQEVPVS